MSRTPEQIEAARVASRKHYLANREKRMAESMATRMKLQAIAREAKDKPCMDCGKSFPTVCMDFDHRDPTTKVGDISRLVMMGSTRKLLEEIKKCDVVCANCHRIRTLMPLSSNG